MFRQVFATSLGLRGRALLELGQVPTGAQKHVDRHDEAGRPIPHACLKIPTGGGKTFLGAAALQRLRMQTGLVLWIVPSKAIYAQTKKAFWTRQHPYRLLLEEASGGRVKVMEKDDTLARADLDNYLCLMLLMLPAANRQKGKEFLKMFRGLGALPDTVSPRGRRARVGCTAGGQPRP